MTTFQIKVSGIILMVIAHVGLFFFPQFLLLRVIGRIAFPLFAWLIANGAYHTRDFRSYGLRLFALAVVSQVPFTLANTSIGGSLFYLNVVFTLSAGLLAVYAIRTLQTRAYQVLAVVACAALASLIHADYGAAGVLSIVAFYVFFGNMRHTVISQTLILGILPIFMWLLEASLAVPLGFIYMTSYLEGFGLLALGWIALYNGSLGIRANMLFYYFYPIQYALIYLGLLLVR